MGISADHAATLVAFAKQNGTKHLLLADFRRAVLPRYDAMQTDEKHPAFRYGKRAYFIVDQAGIVKWIKIQENALDLLNPAEVLAALKASGV